jgi:elongation factor Ts
MQIAAMKPLYVKREDVPAEQIEKEKEILKAQAINEGKPANIAEKIVNGRIEKYFTEICLLEQSFIKDSDKTVEQVLKEKIAAIGENITIRRFARFEMGEGLEKKEENFADEVMKQIK